VSDACSGCAPPAGERTIFPCVLLDIANDDVAALPLAALDHRRASRLPPQTVWIVKSIRE